MAKNLARVAKIWPPKKIFGPKKFFFSKFFFWPKIEILGSKKIFDPQICPRVAKKHRFFGQIGHFGGKNGPGAHKFGPNTVFRPKM